MDKVTFIFLNQYTLTHFVSATKCVFIKPNLDVLAVECNCKGKERREEMIEAAQKDYGAMVIREKELVNTGASSSTTT